MPDEATRMEHLWCVECHQWREVSVHTRIRQTPGGTVIDIEVVDCPDCGMELEPILVTSGVDDPCDPRFWDDFNALPEIGDQP